MYFAPGQSAVEVYVGTKPVEFKTAQPVRKGSLMLIPLRETVEAMGGKVVDGPLRRRVYVTLGRRRVDLSMAGGRSWVNGIPRYVKTAPWISKGQVVVPARFFSDVLGAAMALDPRKGTVQIFPGGGLPTGRPASTPKRNP